MVLAIIIYIVGIFIAYKIMKSWPNTKFEKVWFSCVWPVMVILYGIHLLHTK